MAVNYKSSDTWITIFFIFYGLLSSIRLLFIDSAVILKIFNLLIIIAITISLTNDYFKRIK